VDLAATAAKRIFRATVGLPSASAQVDLDRFRETMGAFPAAVSVITALDEGGDPRGLTCSAFCSLSLEPPLVLACVNQRNGSLRAIRHSEGFVVNLLRSGSDDLSARFASAATDKYDGVAWHAGRESGLPHLRDAVAHVDCELAADIAAGTHAILIGRIRACGAEDPGPSEHATSPLVYWRRAYGCWSKSPSSDRPSRVTGECTA
jgi:flavin reductase (NADH)